MSDIAAAPDIREAAIPAVIADARRDIRAPWAAGIAGILFAILFTAAMVVLRTQPLLSADDPGVAQVFASNSDTLAVIGGLYLAPFSGVAFLWFIAVVRDQIGAREDQFFATVFIGSGLLFVAMLFAASAVASSLFVGVDYLRQPAPRVDEVALVRSLA